MQNAYESGKTAKLRGSPKSANPYYGQHFQYREERMENEVLLRQWDAGFEGKDDPYPEGWA